MIDKKYCLLQALQLESVTRHVSNLLLKGMLSLSMIIT